MGRKSYLVDFLYRVGSEFGHVGLDVSLLGVRLRESISMVVLVAEESVRLARSHAVWRRRRARGLDNKSFELLDKVPLSQC